MTIRDLQPSDLPILRQIAERSGYLYPDPAQPLELVRVLVDDDGRPLMAVGVERIVHLYLWSDKFHRPLAAKRALLLLHDDVAAILRARGWTEVNCFLPPTLAKRFGRRLERSFGWVRNWASWARGI